MATLDALVTEVSDLLSDNEPGCENVRWSKASIRHWLMEGYQLATTVARHKNSAIVEVPLVEGSVQTLPEGYEEFIRVVANPGTMERLVDSAEQRGVDKFKGIYDAPGEPGECVTEETTSGNIIGVRKIADGEYSVTGWEAEPMSATTFYVEPPVPKGYKGRLKVLALKTIDLDATDAVIPMWAHSMAVNWALHRAWMRDVESQYSASRADRALEDFYKLLALARPMNRIAARGGAGLAVAGGEAA